MTCCSSWQLCTFLPPEILIPEQTTVLLEKWWFSPVAMSYYVLMFHNGHWVFGFSSYMQIFIFHFGLFEEWEHGRMSVTLMIHLISQSSSLLVCWPPCLCDSLDVSVVNDKPHWDFSVGRKHYPPAKAGISDNLSLMLMYKWHLPKAFSIFWIF